MFSATLQTLASMKASCADWKAHLGQDLLSGQLVRFVSVVNVKRDVAALLNAHQPFALEHLTPVPSIQLPTLNFGCWASLNPYRSL